MLPFLLQVYSHRQKQWVNQMYYPDLSEAQEAGKSLGPKALWRVLQLVASNT